MAIIGTFNGASIVAFPSDVDDLCMAPNSLEFDRQEVVGSTTSPFTQSQQLFDWQQSLAAWSVGFGVLDLYSADKWESFLMQCRGQLNVFSIGDPKRALPKGTPLGNPVVSGAGQVGYSLVTSGWTPNSQGVLLDGDSIQIGYRLHRVLDDIDSDGSGNATLPIWPPIRNVPTALADATPIITSNCKGLFRLAANSGNKTSTTTLSLFGCTGFAIREAL